MDFLDGVTYGGQGQAGKFLAVGANGTVLASPDAADWTIARPDTALNPLIAIAYGNGVFVAVDDTGTIMTSSDASLWTTQYSNPSLWFNAVVYGTGASGQPGQFVTVGGEGVIITSIAGNLAVRYQHIAKANGALTLKIAVTAAGIQAIVPKSASGNLINVGVFTASGKRVYGAALMAKNGIMTIPLKGLAAGKYFMSASNGPMAELSSPFVVTK